MTGLPEDLEEELYRRIFAKLVKELHEALARTPPHISSYRYVERAYRLALAGLSAASAPRHQTVYLKEERKA